VSLLFWRKPRAPDPIFLLSKRMLVMSVELADAKAAISRLETAVAAVQAPAPAPPVDNGAAELLLSAMNDASAKLEALSGSASASSTSQPEPDQVPAPAPATPPKLIDATGL